MRMTLPAGVLLCVALAGCQRQPPPARVAPAMPPSPLDGIADGPAPPITIKPSFQCPRPVVEGEPVLPLDTPLTELQTLICAEPELALLDRQVHEAYLAARLRSGVDRGRLSKAQAQWEADRDTCLKAADPRDCVSEASRTRRVELALQDPATVARTQLAFTCKGTATPLTAAFYGRLEPGFAVLGFGRQQAIVFVEPSNAGLKYGRSGVDFFVRQGQVKAEFYGRTLACVSPTWRPSGLPEAVVVTQTPEVTAEQAASPIAVPQQARPAQASTSAPAPASRGDAPARPAVSPLAAPMRPPASGMAPMAQAPKPTPLAPARPAAASPVPAPARVATTQASGLRLEQVAPRALAVPASGPTAAAAKVPTAAKATGATGVAVHQATSHATTPSVGSSASARGAAPAPARSPATVAPKVNLQALQATDALVRQVVAQARTAPVSGDAGAPGEPPAASTSAETRP